MLVLGTSDTKNYHLDFATFKVAPSSTVKLLGINIDKNEFKQTPYAFRKGRLLKLPTAKGKTYSIYCLQFRDSFYWNNLPEKVKSSTSLSILKKRLKEHQSY